MQLVLIRHGESVANRDGLLQGHLDAPLSPRGLAQAEALATALAHERFEALYVSDLQRASETGRLLAERLGMEMRLEPRIREIDVGIFTGLSWEQIAARHPEAHARFRVTGDWSQVPGGEGLEASSQRLDSLLAEIGERRVALVAHGAILRRLIHRLLGWEGGRNVFFELHNASFSEIHVTDRGATLLYLNRLPEAAAARATTRSLI